VLSSQCIWQDAFTRLKWLEHGIVLDSYEIVKVLCHGSARVIWWRLIKHIQKYLSLINAVLEAILTTLPTRKIFRKFLPGLWQAENNNKRKAKRV